MRDQEYNDLDEQAGEYAKPSRVLWAIYTGIITIALLVAGGVEIYKYAFPESPADQFARAVDALDSGDNALAQRFFTKLASLGNPAAEYWLADMKEFGLGTAINLPETVRLLQASADKGFVPAEVRLGELYLFGTRIDPNYSKAKELLNKAAMAQNARAQRLLGQMYADQNGQARDLLMAAVNYSAAVRNGDRLAISERDQITKQLTPDQLSQIEPMMRKLGLVK